MLLYTHTNRHINNMSELYTPSTETESPDSSPGEHFHTLVEAHRIDASSPEGRIDQLKQLDAFEIAVLLDVINRSVQGVDESTLVTEHARK